MTAAEQRGRFVAIVGPDGVGKTTLAQGLIDQWEGSQTASLEPDVTVNLVAAVPLITAHEAELSAAQAEAELRRWASLPVHSLVTVDAGAGSEAVVATAAALLGTGVRA